MFQRDYILRLVEQLAKTVGAVLTLKKANRFEEAERAIGEAAKNLVGLDIATLLALPVDQILTLFSPGGSLDAGKCIVVAELLYEHGEIKSLQGEEETAYHSRIRALSLLLEVSGRESLERIPDAARYLRRIEALIEALSAYPTLPTVQKKLVFHHERQGHFADAEDVLFELVDAGHEDFINAGIELYQRLLAKSDDELERGELPREEVEEGLSQLRSRRRST
ncbi:MAG: DUF6483 family protein [Acidobacteriota bacterium]|nr:MAG: DUF6483 family protein [Acidobacteriota bacterium]